MVWCDLFFFFWCESFLRNILEGRKECLTFEHTWYFPFSPFQSYSLNLLSTIKHIRKITWRKGEFYLIINQFTSVQSLSYTSLSITNSQSLLRFMSSESMMPSNHLILCHPLLLLPSIFPSIRVKSNESVLCIRWPKYWNFSFNISPSSEYSGLISFRIDWLDLLAAQGTLKGLLQHHSSKASIPWPSDFFIVQLSHPYMTIGKTIALTRQTFVGKVVSLLFNMPSRLVIAFLPRSKRLLISWL